MISDNFKKSEVCLNEMGAAWALDKTIIQILLPNVSFDRLGWLCSLERAIKINDSPALDSLYEIFEEKLCIRSKLSVWNRNKESFILSCSSLEDSTSSLAFPIEIPAANENDELGFLDYKDKFDTELERVSETCNKITRGMMDSNTKLTIYTEKISTLASRNPSTTQVRGLMSAIADSMNQLSDIEETNTPLLKTHFFAMIDYLLQINKMAGINNESKDGYDVVKELLTAISGTKESLIQMKTSIDTLPKAEKTINKARNRLSRIQGELIDVLDSCLIKSRELIGICFD